MITVVDVGGTKTLIAQFDDSLAPIGKTRFETPKDADQFLATLHQHLKQYNDMSALTVGVPGIVTPNGTILRCGNLPWHDFKLHDLLAKTYNCPVFIQNDAKFAALAEINALMPMPDLGLYITIGTGIGTGIVVEGRLLSALNNSEGGFQTIWDGEKWVAWEDVASGRAFSGHFGKFVHELNTQAEWQWVAEKIALGLYTLIPALQPQVVVVGGGVGAFLDHFRQPLQDLLAKHISSYIPLPEIRVAKHSEDAVLYGGYYYAQHRQVSPTN